MRLLLTSIFVSLALAGKLERWPGNISTFVALPPSTSSNRVNPTSVILYIPDIYGHNTTQARNLAQKISTLGNYIVVAPDIFEGDPIVEGTPFAPDWFERHGVTQVERVLNLTFDEIHRRWGEVKVGGTGYCFGGRVS
jgi:dienelactone hydrolase